MNLLTIVALAMVLLIVAAPFQKRLPLWLVMMLVPIAAALVLGYPMEEINASLTKTMNSTMVSAGYLMFFALIYFTMLTETGMFETIVNAILKPFGGRMNVVILLILTTALSLLCAVTAQISVTYLILFPLLLPLYKRFGLNREYAFILCQTALAVMMWLPWSPAIVNVSVVLGCEAMELSSAASKAAICMAPGIVFQWVYMAWKHKKEHGTWGLAAGGAEEEGEQKENPLVRPKLFWINFLVFLALMVGLIWFRLPPYLVFIAGCAYMVVFVYPNDFGPMVAKAGKTYVNLFIFMLAMSIYLAVFTDTGMNNAIGELLTGIFPGFLTRYMHIILLAVCVVCVRYVPNRVFTLLYPVLVAIGAQFGFAGMAMIAPFIINLTLATGSTPLNPPNFLACSLLEVDSTHYFGTAVKIQSVTNLIAIATAVVMGVMPL